MDGNNNQEVIFQKNIYSISDLVVVAGFSYSTVNSVSA
jgi:hypothetical protein